ncbi:Rieske (2Fe-2S) protein [Caballeronia temeraria]|uniref:Rieske (2Fe-2S) protein n=1 Tax=Caballeronia temeraria TaxID=1777137 RepID=A0A158CGQ9_9BURK|nr:hypothetical protein [Caballeronia temeraria]SAK81461.1 Rieske (2Fe-2S) protein [Caballeronia temeraria]
MATPTVAPLTFQRAPNQPRNCTFNPHDWEILSQYSHPVAFAADIADKPSGRGTPKAFRRFCRLPSISRHRRDGANGMRAEYVSTVSNFPKSMQHRAPEGVALCHRNMRADIAMVNAVAISIKPPDPYSAGFIAARSW